MSGPKNIAPPPPLFSGKAFQGSLKEIFGLQANIRTLIGEIKQCIIIDEQNNIQIDLAKNLMSFENDIKELLKSYTIDVNKKYNLEKYETLNADVAQKINELKKFIHNLKTVIGGFNDAENDYNCYIDMVKYVEQVKSGFKNTKIKLLDALKEELRGNNADILNTVVSELSDCGIDYVMPAFNLGFRFNKLKECESLNKVLEKNEKFLNRINTNALSSWVKRIPESGLNISALLKESEKIKKAKNLEAKSEIIEDIRKFIDTLDNPSLKSQMRIKLENFIKTDRNKAVFHYQQLLSDMIESRNNMTARMKIDKLIKKIINAKTEKELSDEKKKLLAEANDILNNKSVKDLDFESLNNKFEALLSKNRLITDKNNLIIQENEFMKQQMIKAFIGLGYEVMTDMNVIDFEKESNIVMSVPEQENFINLDFNQNGSINYCFLIPEDKKDLSDDQIKNKIIEMENTCKDLKSFVKWLNDNGVNVNLKSLMKADADALITVPQRVRNIVRKNKRKIHNKESLKKQL